MLCGKVVFEMKRSRVFFRLLAALLLLLMGAAGLNPPGFSAFLLAALPWRAVLALLALAAMVIGSLLRGKPGKEQP